jgi:hypothetical protein
MSTPTYQVNALLEQVRSLIGQPGPAVSSTDPISVSQVRLWCAAIGDKNPVYLDEDIAATSVHGDLIAPPAMLQSWTMPGFDEVREPDPVVRAFEMLDAAGYTAIIAVNCEQEYLSELRPGTSVTARRSLDSISDEKHTRLGAGFFVSSVTTVVDESAEVVGTQLYRVFKFKPQANDVAQA